MDDFGVVVANVMNAVTGEKIQNYPAVRSGKFRTHATLIPGIHLQ